MPENKITLCQFSRFFASISILAAGSLGCTHSQPKPTLPQEANPVSGLIHYDYKPGELTQLCKAALQATEQRLNEIPKVASDARTMDNTLLPFETITADFSDVTTPLTFMGYVSTNEKIHDEGSACEDEVNKFIVRVTTRKDLYEAIKAAKPRNKDETRLLSETLLVFEKNGLKLSDDKLAQVKELLQRLSTLQTQFSDNLNKDNTTVTFDAKELAGVSNDFLKRLKKTVDDKYIVNTKSTDYLAVAENASNSETRHKMLLAYENKATDKNTKLLEEAIVLRQQIGIPS